MVLSERIWYATDAFSSVPLPYATSEGFVKTRLWSHVLFILIDSSLYTHFLGPKKEFYSKSECGSLNYI